MALSNWLTRGEWNAAWLLGISPLEDGEAPVKSLGEQLRRGIKILHEAGYRDWTGLAVNDQGDAEKDPDSKYGAQACTAEGNNAGALAEHIAGTFDARGRFEEACAWLKERSLCLDIVAEVERQLAEIDA